MRLASIKQLIWIFEPIMFKHFPKKKNTVIETLFSATSVRLDGWCQVEVTVKVCNANDLVCKLITNQKQRSYFRL